MAKEFWEADEKVSTTGGDDFWKGDEPAAKQALPAGVTPSEGGAGRGSVNPPILAARRAAAPAPTSDSDLSRPAGVLARDIKREPAPDRRSLLERSVQSGFDANEERLVRESRRANWEQAQIDARTPVARGTTAPRVDAQENMGRDFALGGVGPLEGSNPVVRAGAKLVAGAAQGIGGTAQAIGDVTGIEPLARAGKATAEGAEAFQKGLGKSGDNIEGFGPRSPVPYLVEQGEGAASSLGQSMALAAGLGSKAVIPMQAILQGGQSYNEARQAGMDPATALARAIPQGAFEAIGEKFQGLDRAAGAMGTLLNAGAGAAAKRTAADVLVRAGIREIPGEVLTYLGQTGTDLIPGIGLNPNMTMAQFLDGLRDTVVQSAMMGGATAGAGHAAGGQANRAPQMTAAGLARSKGFLTPETAPSSAPAAPVEASAPAAPAASVVPDAPVAPVAAPEPPPGPLARAAATAPTLNDGVVTGERDPSTRPKSLAEQNAAMTEIARIEAQQDAENELAAAMVADTPADPGQAGSTQKESSNEATKPEAPQDARAETPDSPDRTDVPNDRGSDSSGRDAAKPVADSVPGPAPAVAADAARAEGVADDEAAAARPADRAGMPSTAPRPAAPAGRGRAPAAPATYESVEAAAEFVRKQRARGTSIAALPYTDEAGTVTLAMKGTPEYQRAIDQREQRVQAKARDEAGIREGDILTKSGGAFKAKVAAINAQKRAGAGHVVVPVKGGFVVRKEAVDVSATNELPGVAAAAARPGGDNGRGGVAAELGGAGTPARAAVPGAPVAAGEQGAVLSPAHRADTALKQRVRADEPPLADGMVRLYHGSAQAGRTDGKAWFSTDRKYAENYRQGAELQYVDMPADKVNKLADPDGYGQTVEKGFTLNHEFDSEETGPRKVLRATPSAPTAIAEAAHEAATSPTNDLPAPTPAQIEAGNYKKGHIRVHGLDISVENPAGSERSGKRPDGTTWAHTMSDHYGYIKRTEGADGEQVDVYVGPKPDSGKVFVVDQLNQADGSFDEHKVMLGYASQPLAMRAYRANFDKGWKVGKVTEMTVDQFKAWLKDGNTAAPAARAEPARGSGKRESKAARIKREAEEARAKYFTPGNVVRGYGDHFDRVISYTPAAADGQVWKVTVRQVKKTGPATFEVIPGERERTHSTQPSERVLRAGPTGRMPVANAATGDEQVLASRGGNKAGGAVATTQAAVNALVSRWANAPRVVVVQNMDDAAVPAAVRQHNEGQRAQGAEGEPEGFFYAGKVYLVADQLGSQHEVARVLFHEALGHYGLRGVFGAELTPILKQLAGLRRADVEAKAKAYGLDMASEQERLMAAEEVLAEMAEKNLAIGFVKRAIAAVRTWLRANAPGFRRLELSDEEIVRNYLAPAKGWVERGRQQATAPGAGAAAPAFSLGESTLRELSKADDLFALPKSDKATVEEIAHDNDPEIKVRALKPYGGRSDYLLTLPDGKTARLMVREPNPYGPSLYGYDLTDGAMGGEVSERPGDNPEDVPPTGDVWIDVSLLDRGEAGYGKLVYNIAATYAHNTGRIFIGDPAGLSNHAMRRRLEQMLSSALKFGTTAHLAPHPDQVRGGGGVPGLRWVYGDHVGNVERMIAASVEALDNAFPQSKVVAFDPANGTFFRTDTGATLSRAQLVLGLGRSLAAARKVPGSLPGKGEAGWRTVSRAAVFRALSRGEGEGGSRADRRSDGLLDRNGRGILRAGAEHPGERIFYSRSKADPGTGSGDDAAGPSGARADASPGGLSGAPAAKPNPALARAVFGGAMEWTRDQNGKPVKVSEETEKYKAIDTDERGQMLLRHGHIDADQLKRWKESKLDIYDGAINNRFRKHFESPGIVWKDAELREIFKLDDAGVAAYRDLRATADTSIARHAVADMLRLAGEDGLAVREQVMGEPLEVASETLRDHLLGLATANPERNKVLTDRANRVIEIADEANDRMAGGFVPDDMKAEARPSGWESTAPTNFDKLIYEFQDGKVDLKRTQEAIARAGNTIDERFDARLAETLYSGRVAKRSQAFLDVEATPLLRMMARMGVGQDELGDYLHARGAPERNAQIAKVNPDMPDGGAGKNSKGLLLTNDAARKYIADIPVERRAQLEQLAAKVDAITAGTRQLLVAEGLEKAETIAAWEKAYKNYVPMFREDVEFSRLTVNKRATGSEKKAVNILSHVLMQREAAITRAEKNRVNVALYGLALTNPNPDFWVTIRPGAAAETIQQDLQRMGVDPLVAEAGMQGVPTIRTVDPATNQVVERLNPMYRQLPGAINVKINGENRVLLLNEKDPRAARLAAAMKGQDQLTELDISGSIIGRTTRWLAAVNTQYNPVFGVVNFLRDTMGGVVNLGSTELRNEKTRVLAGLPGALQGIGAHLAGRQDGGRWARLFEQFQQDGGQTGFRELFRDGGERARAIEAQLAKMSKAGKLSPLVVPRMMLSLLDGFNTMTENAVRLSAYAAALDKGMSRPAAARLARELTVDFNRKGRATREVGPLYAFFNAAVQGNERTVRVLRGPTGARIVAGGLALGVIQALMLAAAGYDDDEIPDFAKARAFIIPLLGKEKKYISIPLPLGLHVLPNTGRIVTEMVIGDHKGMGKKAVDALGEILGAFNPLGGGNIFTMDGALRTLAPTVVDPFVEIGFNKNFAGNQIERDARGESDSRPGAARARESTQRQFTGQAYLGISKAINKLTGGSDFERGAVSPTPERLRYIAQVAGGGVLRELEKVINASVAASRGEKVSSSSIPVASRFYGEVDRDQVARSRYYEGSKRVEALEGSLKAAKKGGDAEAVERLQRTNPEVGLIHANNRAQQAIQKLNKQAAQVIGDRETLREIDQRRFETMRALSDAIRDMERSQRPPTLAERLRGEPAPAR